MSGKTIIIEILIHVFWLSKAFLKAAYANYIQMHQHYDIIKSERKKKGQIPLSQMRFHASRLEQLACSLHIIVISMMGKFQDRDEESQWGQ